MPISGLLERLDTYRVADDFTLLVELHSVYSSLFGHQSFSRFLPFGRQVLDAFNEVDQQLINARRLFEEVRDFKSIEALFPDDEEQRQSVIRFWETFLIDPRTQLQESFLDYWNQLHPLYEAYRKRLTELNLAYEGMAWRQAVEQIDRQHFFDPYNQVVFAGFYALNRTEDVLFDRLKSQGKLRLFKDVDSLYLEQSQHEAGRYLRKGILADPEVPWTGNHFEDPKDLYAVKGCIGLSACARELGADLLLLKDRIDGNNTVVVLTDESLLFPLMQACRGSGLRLNPSMGFPVKDHPVMRVMKLIQACRMEFKEGISRPGILRYLEDAFEEPLIRRFFAPDSEHRKDKNQPRLTPEDYPAELVRLFSVSPDSIADEEKQIREFISRFKFADEEWIERLHLHFLRAIDHAIRLLAPHTIHLDIHSWWELLNEHISRERVPFESDPTGIPVVGFLETRVLDYSNVFIATLNEGTLPSSSTSNSLIPYALRKAYRLPCKEEQQAVTAYHFYRLLQRAREIRLYYNTEQGATGGGERSRYLFQLHLEVNRKHPPKELHYLIQHGQTFRQDPIAFVFPKSPAVIDILRKRFSDTPDNRENFRGFSASALSSYINCSLRFYLDQVVRLRPDDQTVTLSAGHFGNVLHKSMEMAYPHDGEVHAQHISSQLERVESLVDSGIRDAYGRPVDSGHDYLMRGVLIELVKRLLNFDEANSPFRMIGVEKHYQSSIKTESGGQYLVKGIIDRIDLHDGFLRILDYKTGKEELKTPKDPNLIFSDKRFKLNLQLLLYAMLTREQLPEHASRLKAGIFRLREFENSIHWLVNDGVVSEQAIDDFRSGLAKLIDEIMNPEIPFRMTEKLENCRYCSYAGLCSRRDV